MPVPEPSSIDRAAGPAADAAADGAAGSRVGRAGAPALDRAAGRQALWVFAAVWLAVLVLVRLDVTVPLIGHVGSALVAMVFLFVPSELARRRGEDLEEYGLRAAPVRQGLVAAALAMLAIFPLFAVGYFAFYEIACSTGLAALAPPGMCARYGGIGAVHLPPLTGSLLEFCAVQLVVVALPEELFFRGLLLGLLRRRWPAGRALGGAKVGWALVLSAAAFALVHLPREGDPRALATFFPGLLFGWLRLRTGSLLAPVLTHAGSNILIRLLDLSVLR